MPRARMLLALLLLLSAAPVAAAEAPLDLTLERIVSRRPALSGRNRATFEIIALNC